MDSFSKFVATLAKPGADIVASMTPASADLWHGGTGVSTEAGELMEAVQNYMIFNVSRDNVDFYPDPVGYEDAIRVNMIEECGDLYFYAQMIRNNIYADAKATGDVFDLLLTRALPDEEIDHDAPFGDTMLYLTVDMNIAAVKLLDLIKKIVVYNKAVPLDALIEALEEVEILVGLVAQALGVPIQFIEDENRAKLAVRYAGMTYTDDAANARADKAA